MTPYKKRKSDLSGNGFLGASEKLTKAKTKTVKGFNGRSEQAVLPFPFNTIKANLGLMLIGSVILSACASSPYQEPTPDKKTSAPVENRAVVDGDVLPLPNSRSIKSRPMSNDAPSSPVVKKLMSSAQTQREAGNLEGAANSLERALRIEPRNAKLWSRLADLRYAQKLWQKSIQLANKSNTLAGNSRGLRRQNWYLIANAYTALGDAESSRKYREKLRE